MTCIIGGKCSDGVVLVADRKVICYNRNVTSREKIFKDFHPYVIAASGDTNSFDNFKHDALTLAQKSRGTFNDTSQFSPLRFDSSVFSGVTQVYSSPTSYPIIHQPTYLKGLEQLVQERRNSIRRNKDQYVFDVLIASQTSEGLAHLSYIDDNGVLSEIFDPYVIIGSKTAPAYGSVFIKPLYTDEIKIIDFAKLAYFTIKYIDRFNLDDTIGLVGKKPQAFFIPNKGEVEEASDNLITEFESDTDKMLDNFEKNGISKLL